jgi:hypothetical protein
MKMTRWWATSRWFNGFTAAPSVLQLGEVIAHHQLERYHMRLSNTLELHVFVFSAVDVTPS